MAVFSGTSIAPAHPGSGDPGLERTEREQAMKHVALQMGEYRRYERGPRHMSEEETGGRAGENGGAWTADDQISPLRPNPRRLPPGMY